MTKGKTKNRKDSEVSDRKNSELSDDALDKVHGGTLGSSRGDKGYLGGGLGSEEATVVKK